VNSPPSGWDMDLAALIRLAKMHKRPSRVSQRQAFRRRCLDRAEANWRRYGPLPATFGEVLAYRPPNPPRAFS